MTVKLSTTINNIERDILDFENSTYYCNSMSLWKEWYFRKNSKQ